MPGLRRAVAALLLAATVCAAAGQQQQKVLVLLERLDLQQSHSWLLGDLSARGYEVEVKQLSDKGLRLKRWDEWLYDKLLILGSQAELGGALDVGLLTQFVDAGHDLLLALDGGASDELRALSQELGVDVAAAGTAVIDHFAYERSLGAKDHAAVLADAAVASRAVLPEPLPGPVLYRGTGLSVSPESELAFLALSGSPTAYCAKSGEAVIESGLAGASLGLVALVQARNNARAAVLGSLDMCSDAYIKASAASSTGQSVAALGNAALCSAVSKWAFHERGVLRAGALRHRIVGGEESPEVYRINDEVEVEVDIMECNDGACKPYTAEDVQVEFVMLDPHLRTPLRPDAKGTFSTRVVVPDVYGVFKWVLDYKRLGYSYLELTEIVPVRPFRHNEYERFILQAYPYYAASAALMAGFVLAGLLFRHSSV